MDSSQCNFVSQYSLSEQRMMNLNRHNMLADILSRAVVFKGQLDVGKFREAVNRVVNRHRIFKCRYSRYTNLRSFKDLEVDYLDVSAMSGDRIHDFIHQCTSSPFRLADDQLLGLTLFKCEGDEHILLIKCHHIITDGASLAAVMMEFLVCYLNLCTGNSEAEEITAKGFNDYIQFESDYLASERGTNAKKYWQEKLARQQVPVVEEGNNTVSLACEVMDKELSGRDFDKLAYAVAKHRVSFHSYFTAAYQYALSQLLENNFCLSATLTLRTKKEHRSIIGPMFRQVNIEVHENEMWSNKVLRVFKEIGSAKRTIYAADTIGPHGSIGTDLPPKYCNLINYFHAEDSAEGLNAMSLGDSSELIDLGNGLAVQALSLPSRLTPYGIFLSIGKFGNSFRAKFVYNSHSYKREDVEKLYDIWKICLLENYDDDFASMDNYKLNHG